MQHTVGFPHPASRCSVLAINTAFDLCSVALITQEHCEMRVSDKLRKHADEVLPMVDSLLSGHKIKMASLTTLAMVSGPGSFTGLRIGTAVVQGLAFGANLPVVCVSSLALIARAARRQCATESIILACIHAREDEFYFAAYRDNLADSPRAEIADSIFSRQQILQLIADHVTSSATAGEVLLAGSGWQHEHLQTITLSTGCKLVPVVTDALLLAELAVQDYEAGRAVDAADATPVYIKDEMEYRTV